MLCLCFSICRLLCLDFLMPLSEGVTSFYPSYGLLRKINNSHSRVSSKACVVYMSFVTKYLVSSISRRFNSACPFEYAAIINIFSCLGLFLLHHFNFLFTFTVIFCRSSSFMSSESSNLIFRTAFTVYIFVLCMWVLMWCLSGVLNTALWFLLFPFALFFVRFISFCSFFVLLILYQFLFLIYLFVHLMNIGEHWSAFFASLYFSIFAVLTFYIIYFFLFLMSLFCAPDIYFWTSVTFFAFPLLLYPLLLPCFHVCFHYFVMA